MLRLKDWAYCGRGDEKTTGDLNWAKWGYWEIHSLLFLSVYTAILVLPHTRWRVSLPDCCNRVCTY